MIDPPVRRFACTACGKCCDRGPEMELGESLALADLFLLSMVFKVHSLPRNERGETGRRWWKSVDTPLGPGPALIDTVCGIYERRPQTCRTVPLHYSRPTSTLVGYLDGFVATPGYACETTDAPEILRGSEILSVEAREGREAALRIAQSDRDWKDALVGLMQTGASAKAAGLPTFEDVLSNSDRGYASMVPIHVAWRAAAEAGLMTGSTFEDLIRKQIALAERAVASRPDRHEALAERLRLLRSALAAV